MDDGLRTVEAGVCSTWPLPPDPTCAGIARRMFRRAADGLVLDQAVADDGVSMVSELAANTLHAQREQRAQRGQDAARQRPGAQPGQSAYTTTELWLYLRDAGQERELVCKVFDTFPGWLRGNVPGRGVRRAPADVMSGRGLEVVHELSKGRWGHHLTRARLAGFQVRGKAVWFAVPAPEPPDSAWPPGYLRMSVGEAMTDLERGLAARGFGGTMVRADDPAGDMAVLSVCSPHGLVPPRPGVAARPGAHRPAVELRRPGRGRRADRRGVRDAGRAGPAGAARERDLDRRLNTRPAQARMHV